jgi:hypothetical protein
MEKYLAEDDVIDVSHPAITALAARLRRATPVLRTSRAPRSTSPAMR